MARNTRGQAEALIKLVGEDQVSDLILGITKKVERVGDATEDNAKATKAFTESWGQASVGINAALEIIGKVAEAAAAVYEMAREAARDDAIGQAFARASGGVGQAQAAIGRLKEAVRGTVSETDLQHAASLLQRVGVSSSQTVELFSLATKAAAETGESTAEMVQKFSQAIADRSDGVFRAIGIEVDFGQVIGQTTQALGVNADAISMGHKTQLVLNKTLAEGAEKFGDVDLGLVSAKTNLEKLSASYDNAKSAVGAWGLKTAEVIATVVTLEEGAAVKRLRAQRAEKLMQETGMARLREMLNAHVARLNAAKEEEKAAKMATEAQKRHTDALRDLLVQEEEQRRTLLRNTMLMGKMAEEMGNMPQAARLWSKAIDAAKDSADDLLVVVSSLADKGIMIGDPESMKAQLAGKTAPDKDPKDPKKPPRRRKKKKTDAERDRELQEGAANFIRKMTNANIELQNAVATSQRAMDNFDADRSIEQLRRFREEAQRTGSDLRGMAAAAFQWNKVMDEAGGAAAAKGVIDMLGAISGNMQLHAGLMGAFEAAESIRSFVSQDYAAGVGHLAASVAYFAAAGTAGAGAAGGGGGGRPPAPTRPLSLGAPDQKSEKGGMNVTLNLSGATIIGGNERQVGADLARMVQQGMMRRGGKVLEYSPG
jgi:hypothetical protein